MTEDDFRTYIAAFNARDFAGFRKYYADDVEFNLGDRKQIIGAQGIIDFYTGRVRSHRRRARDDRPDRRPRRRRAA